MSFLLPGQEEVYTRWPPLVLTAPEGGGHFLDHAELDAIGGAESPDVLGHHYIEVTGGLIGKDRLSGERAVAEGVAQRLGIRVNGDGDNEIWLEFPN